MTRKATAGETLARMRSAATAPRAPAASEKAAGIIGMAATEPRPERRKATTRYTIDLAPDERRALRTVAFEHDTDASVVIRALIRLLRDPLVYDAVRDELSSG